MSQINRGTLPPNSQRNGVNILLLSDNFPGNRFLPKITEKAKEMGHTLALLETQPLKLLPEEERFAYVIDKASGVDVVLPRSKKEPSLLALEVLENLGLPTLNPSFAIRTAKDQLKTLFTFDRYNLPVPKTGFITKKNETFNQLAIS